MTAFRVCLFCGIPSEKPHDSQAACIAALQEEIDRTRELLAVVDAARMNPPEDSSERREVQTT